MNIFKEAKEAQQYMAGLRNDLHTHPELSGKEYCTVARIDQELTALGIEHVVVENGGVLGFIEGREPGKTVLLRADCDALPINESETNNCRKRTVISQNPGVMHACGHDAHTASLLGAAKVLQENRSQFSGKVILLFERGEEGTNNLAALLEYIYQNKIHVDSCFGTHVWGTLDTGKVAIFSRETMATGLWLVDITIKGQGGHGSRPDLSNNPIDCFVAIYNALQATRMRYTSPFAPVTFSIGKLNAGEASNVIPDELHFSGSYRTFDYHIVQKLMQEDLRIMESIGKAYGCTVEPTIFPGGAGCISDPECADLARKVIGDAIGAESIQQMEPGMGSDSFSTALMMWPGVYMLVGTRNTEKGTGENLHTPYFDVDEDTLPVSASCYVAYALGFLSSDIDTSDRTWKDSPAALYKEFGTNGSMRSIYKNLGLDETLLD